MRPSSERMQVARNELRNLQLQLMGLYRLMTDDEIDRAPTIDELRDAAENLKRQRDQAIDVGMRALQCKHRPEVLIE